MQMDSCLPITCVDLNDTIKYWVRATNSHGQHSFGWCELRVKGDGEVFLECNGLNDIEVDCEDVAR